MRLIDADALAEKAYQHGEHPDVSNPFADGVDAVDMSDIDNATTIDAVPVIRCRECKYRTEYYYCGHPRHEVFPPVFLNDFCSYGKKERWC